MSDEKIPYDASDPASVKEQIRVSKRREASEKIVLRQIMGSNEGRAWMFKVLSMCHLFRTSYSRDTGDMAFSEGERNIGLMLYAEIMQACPNRYIEMMSEAVGE